MIKDGLNEYMTLDELKDLINCIEASAEELADGCNPEYDNGVWDMCDRSIKNLINQTEFDVSEEEEEELDELIEYYTK